MKKSRPRGGALEVINCACAIVLNTHALCPLSVRVLTIFYRVYYGSCATMEKVVLVSLSNRTREVRFSSDSTGGDLSSLEKAIRNTFSDVVGRTSRSQLIVQVKSAAWEGVFVDVLPGNEVETGAQIRVHVEDAPEQPEPLSVMPETDMETVRGPVGDDPPPENPGTSTSPAKRHPPTSDSTQTRLVCAGGNTLGIEKPADLVCSPGPANCSPEERDCLLEKARIFRKESSHGLTRYQKSINEEAGVLVLKNPSLLCNRGELLELARVKVVDSGYTFVKGKSRAKRLASPDEESPKVSRVKISAEVRQKRVRALEEDVANLDQQLSFKEKRRQQAENIRNYKACEEITQEIRLVTQRRRQLFEELSQYRKKERKAKWYQRNKGKGKKGSSSSHSSDASAPLSSPGSTNVDAASESDTDTPLEYRNEPDFQEGLPVTP